jgi:hypothetical protein
VPNTTYLALPYPALSAAPNVPQDIQGLAGEIDDTLSGIIRCTSSTRPTTREAAVIYETDTDALMHYNGSWLPLLDALTQSYTPVFSASTSGGTQGNGTLTGRYGRVGGWTQFQINFTIGSTTTGGSGRWLFTLPTAPTLEGVAAAICEDTSASQRFGGSAWFTGGGIFSIAVGAGGNIGASSAVPFTWATGDKLMICGRYY